MALNPKLLVLAAVALAGCAPFRLKAPPPGFAVVESASGPHQLRLKASDDVGLAVVAFDNVEGGTLPFWSEDLVDKLQQRGYVLERRSPARSKNGVVGTRFDFRYVTPHDKAEKFYTAVLFATDEHRVVIQVAGAAKLAAAHVREAEEVARRLVVRGCRGRKVCSGGSR